MQRLLMTAAVVLFPAYEALAEDLSAGLKPEQLNEIRAAVDRGIQFIATQQNADGSFGEVSQAPECTTSFVVLALLSRGHQPGQGRYGRLISRAIEWLLAIQRDDGSFSIQPRSRLPDWISHPLTGVALCEAYSSGTSSDRTSEAIKQALAYSRETQQKPKLFPSYAGGWHYGKNADQRRPQWSTLSPSCWELYFMRSAHSAGFRVQQTSVDEGLGFIARCYKPGPLIAGNWGARRLPVGADQGVFFWYPKPPPGHPIWADTDTTAAAMLTFQLHRKREDPMVLKAADWLAKQPIAGQGMVPSFYYTCYITSHAMAQVGGEPWQSFYPQVVNILLPYQDPNGNFRIALVQPWKKFVQRPSRTTALSILCLTLPDQLLPIHQR